MNRAELRLEIKHARYMVNFYNLHKLGSYRASETYHIWEKRLEGLRVEYKTKYKK